jgi:hypothetical protein
METMGRRTSTPMWAPRSLCLYTGHQSADIRLARNVVPVLVLELVGLIRLDVLGEKRSHPGNPSVQDVRKKPCDGTAVIPVKTTATIKTIHPRFIISPP